MKPADWIIFNENSFDFGHFAKELDSFDWFENIHPDDFEENTGDGNYPYQQERILFWAPFKNRQGEYRWHLSRALSQKTKPGKIIMWIGTSTDIQDQRKYHASWNRKVKERTEQLNYLNNELQMQTAFLSCRKIKIHGVVTKWISTISGEMPTIDGFKIYLVVSPVSLFPTFDKVCFFRTPGRPGRVIKMGNFSDKSVWSNTYTRIVNQKGEIKYCRSTGKLHEEHGKTILIGSVQDISKDISLNESLQSKESWTRTVQCRTCFIQLHSKSRPPGASQKIYNCS